MSGGGLTRRDLMRASMIFGGLGLAPSFGLAQARRSAGQLENLTEFRRLVAANRVLARESVVDAFGHVSVRDPRNARRYVMARSRSPELVEFDDLMEFELDGTPLDARGRTPYGERMIHGALYEARSDVNAVVHNHSYAVLPFTLTQARLRPVIHMASTIGSEIPVWDIRDRFGDTDMLVRSMEQGRDLARALGQNTCLLMRGHGVVVAGRGLKEVVLTSVYLQVNAQVQAQALALGELRPLSEGEVALSSETQFSPLGLDRAWEYFCLRAGVDPI